MPDSGFTPHDRPARLVRLDLWLNPVFDEIIGATPGIALSVLPAKADDARTLAGLKSAHAYHVSAAKDELPRQWFVSESLIAQCPDLVCVSSGGAQWAIRTSPAIDTNYTKIYIAAGGSVFEFPSDSTANWQIGSTKQLVSSPTLPMYSSPGLDPDNRSTP